MKKPSPLIFIAVASLLMLAGCAQVPAKRVGMVIQLRPEALAKYQRLHADSSPGVRDLLTKYHMHDFSIYLQRLDGKWYEFGAYTYTGHDYAGDMAKLDREPRNIAWLRICDPMHISLPGSKGWTMMKRVYFNP